MKKVFILILLLAAAGGVYYYFYYLKKDRHIGIYDLPPAGAVWVYESNQAALDWNQLVSYPFWKNISGIPFLRKMETQFERLDSVAGNGGALDKALRNNKLLASCHISAQNAFEYVFYFKIRSGEEYALIERIIESFHSKEGYSVSNRSFSGYDIGEIFNKSNDKTFSWVFVNDHFVGSFSPFLVEDVIRNVENKTSFGFFNKFTHLDSFNKIVSDNGNLYINTMQFAEFLAAFSGTSVSGLRKLANFSESIFLDFEMESQFLLFNGVCYAPVDSGNYFINIFRNQRAAALRLDHLIPNRTAALFQFSISDPKKWQADLSNYWQVKDPALAKRRADFAKANELTLSEFANWISGVGQAVIESVDPQKPDKLVYIAAKDVNEGLYRFNKLAETLAEQNEDTVYRESFGELSIGMINMADLPGLLFGPMFSGFENSYYMVYDGFMIIASSPAILKSLISDIEMENVWGKSGKHTRFLENVLPESNIGMIVNMERSWNIILHSLHPSWRQAFMEHSRKIQSFEFIALQFNQVDNQFYTSLIASVSDQERPVAMNETLKMERESVTDAPIITKPFIVRNFANQTYETIVQDSLNQIYLFSDRGELVWKLQMKDSIVSDIYQLDYYKNGLYQYLYADSRSVKLIDRKGNFVAGFPLYFPDSVRIRSLSLIDYDKSKNYRMLVSDQQGRLFMFSMSKQNLAGWDPLTLHGPLAAKPEHFRVQGRDCILAVEEGGTIHLFNRRGEYYDGYPVNLESGIRGLFIENEGGFDETVFAMVNQKGIAVRINLYGETVSSTQLYKPSAGTQFILCPDVSGKTYVIVRQDFNRLSMLNPAGETLFEKDYIVSDDLGVQYYYFGLQNQVFAVADRMQEFTYLYDETGLLIGSQPLESGFEIGLIYSEAQKRFRIYSCYDNKLTVSSFNK